MYPAYANGLISFLGPAPTDKNLFGRHPDYDFSFLDRLKNSGDHGIGILFQRGQAPR